MKESLFTTSTTRRLGMGLLAGSVALLFACGGGGGGSDGGSDGSGPAAAPTNVSGFVYVVAPEKPCKPSIHAG